MYIDYTYYTGTYYGTLIPSADFNKYELRGRSRLDALTFNSIKDLDAVDRTDAMKMALCEIMDNWYENESKRMIKSESNGELSQTYKDAKSLKVEDRNIAMKWLWDTGYMYNGTPEDTDDAE